MEEALEQDLDPDIFRQHFQEEMLRYLDLETLRPLLMAAGLLTEPEHEQISPSYPYTRHERIIILTSILSRKGEKCVPKFIDCLKQETTDSGNAELLNVIEEKLPTILKTEGGIANYPGLGTKRRLYNENKDLPWPKRRAASLDSDKIDGLRSHLNIVALMPHLNKEGLLSRSDQDYLINISRTDDEKIEQLVRVVEKKSDGVDKLVRAVSREKTHSGHPTLFRVLSTEDRDCVERDGGTMTEPDSERSKSPQNEPQITTMERDHVIDTIRHRSPMKEYTEYLRKFYTSKALPSDPTKWAPSSSKKYINLALIEKGEVNRTEADEYTKATIHGDIDDIMKQKKRMDLNEVAVAANPNEDSYPKYILIEGAPGVGKTTFAWEFSKNWGNETLLHEYKIVLLLRLREKRVQQMESLPDLFYYSNKHVRKQVAREVEQVQGEGVLLILEGFDELPLAKRDEEFLLYRIITREVLPAATVIVTTRHSASAFIFEHFGEPDQHIEILGFTRENITSYYESVMSKDPKVLEEFKKYLHLHPHIYSAMYVPLHCAIVVEVYMNSFYSQTTGESSTSIPKTMTQLYYSLAKCLLKRYLKSHKKYGKMQFRMHSFKDFPEKVQKQINVISKLAFDGLLQDKVIFTDADVPDNFEALELMQSTKELYVVEGTVSSYNFIHLTLQEFLAAYYIHSQDTLVWVEEFKKFKSHERMKIMLRFLAGLTGFNGVTPKLARSIVFLVDARQDREITVDGLHWLYEAQFEEARYTASVLGKSGVKLNCTWMTVSQFDCFVLGYCISRSKCKWELEMCECDIGEDGLEVLMKAIKTSKHPNFDIGYISALRFRGNGITANSLNQLFLNAPQPVFAKLKEIELGNNKIDGSTCDVIADQIVKPDVMRRLNSISLSGNRDIGKGGATKLLKAMSLLPSRKLLSLFNTKVSVEETHLVAELMETPPGLEVVFMGGTDLTTEIADRMLKSLLKGSTNTKQLYIGGAKFSSTTIKLLDEVLRRNKLLEVIDLRYCGIDEEGGKVILEALSANTTLKDIMITKGNSLGMNEASEINKRFPQEEMRED